MSIKDNFPTIKPSLNLDFANTKVLDPRITFSRPTSAVYYDGQTVTKAEENLLSYSQEFENAYWGKNSTTVVANSIDAPDGTTTADTLSAAGTGLNALFRSVIHPSGLNTVSIYAKKGTKSVLQFSSAALGVPAGRANFDLDTGSLGTVDVAWDASIIDAGNGWYRCVATFIGTGTTGNFLVSMQDSTTAARDALSTAGNLYLWGLQWEVRDAVTAYQPTTTQPITNYIPTLLTAPANTARFDHNPVTGESLGLLVEEQRTNLLTYSSDYTNVAWLKGNSTITANTIVAPDGTLTASKLIESTSAGYHYLQESITFDGTTKTISIYAKAAERNWIALGTGAECTFNLSTGTIGALGVSTTSASITPVGNGWYRCSVTGADISGGNYVFLQPNSTAISYTGDGVSGVYLWGAQLEAGSFPTSYIKTEASQVTRSADSASMTGANFSDWYRPDEGSLFVDFKFELSGYAGDTAMFVGGGNVIAYRSANETTGTNVVIYNKGVFEVDVADTQPTVAGNTKTAFCYATNDFALTVNGGAIIADSSVIVPTTMTTLNIGAGAVGGAGYRECNTTIKKLAYYPQRLSNENLQALTS